MSQSLNYLRKERPGSKRIVNDPPSRMIRQTEKEGKQYNIHNGNAEEKLLKIVYAAQITSSKVTAMSCVTEWPQRYSP